MFNIHGNKTANGVTIVEGLRVRTNDWTEGVVKVDNQADVENNRCCGEEYSRGQVMIGGNWFSDHDTNNKLSYPCTACRHDHWFTVEFPAGGASQYNGERLFAL